MNPTDSGGTGWKAFDQQEIPRLELGVDLLSQWIAVEPNEHKRAALNAALRAVDVQLLIYRDRCQHRPELLVDLRENESLRCRNCREELSAEAVDDAAFALWCNRMSEEQP
jgi:hypothetical protein